MNRMLKSKILGVALMTLLLFTTLASTMCFAAEDKTVVEPKLNTKIYFEGNTYTFHNGKRVRKSYADGELGCGIVSIIVKNKTYGVYVTGEGWISKDQIKESEKYISLDFDTKDLRKEGLKSTLKINGEYTQVESENTGIIRYEDGKLIAEGNGITTIKFTTKENKEIEVLATVYGGDITLNVPEKTIAAEGAVIAEIADKKVNVTAEGDAKAALTIEDGAIGVTADGNGNVKAEVDGKEVLDANINADASAKVSKDGLEANANASQELTLVQKLKLKLNERADAKVDNKGVEANAGADASVNDKQVASGDVGAGYEYGAKDPTASIKAELGDKEVINKKGEVPILSSLRSLLSRFRK